MSTISAVTEEATDTGRDAAPEDLVVAGPELDGLPISARGVRLERGNDGRLNLVAPDGRVFKKVKVVWAAPLTQPGRWLCVLTEKNREICRVEWLEQLDAESGYLAQKVLDQFYPLPIITRILGVQTEHGPQFWQVETDRGPCSFTLRLSDHTVLPYGPRSEGLVLIDAAANRYLIRDVAALDSASLAWLELVE